MLSNYYKIMDNNLIRFIATIGTIAILTFPVKGQDTFEQWLEEETAAFDEFQQAMETGLASDLDEYEAYREHFEQEFENFRNEMEQQWGDFRERSIRNWVEYKDDGSTRIHVDLESGDGSVEVLVDEDPDQARAELVETVYDALQSNGTEYGFETEALPNRNITDESVLEGQLQKQNGESDQDYARRLVEESTESQTVTGADGRERTVLSVSFDLAPDHIQQRADRVSDLVVNFAAEYDLDPPLVFAIIHVESFYNPTAVSHANAKGLMQLVPTTAGVDAYEAVYGESKVPTRNFLFDPANNITLGCAYIDILSNRYFRNVESELSRQYVSIAAYNTGAGNVARTYTGNTSVSAAIAEINARGADENFAFLVENLPFEETRNYLQKIDELADQYRQWTAGM